MAGARSAASLLSAYLLRSLKNFMRVTAYERNVAGSLSPVKFAGMLSTALPVPMPLVSLLRTSAGSRMYAALPPTLYVYDGGLIASLNIVKLIARVESTHIWFTSPGWVAMLLNGRFDAVISVAKP